jgi:hypothetical protein
MAKKAVTVGSTVRLTTKHLKCSGQYGSAGHSRWIVTSIEGDFAVTNEPTSPELLSRLYTPEEIEAYPTLRFHRIHLGNLEVVRS